MPVHNKIEDLRDHLFAALEGLRDEEQPLDIARAKAIAHVARVLVDSAKVEVEFLRVTGALKSTDFMPVAEDATRQLPAGRRSPS